MIFLYDGTNAEQTTSLCFTNDLMCVNINSLALKQEVVQAYKSQKIMFYK